MRLSYVIAPSAIDGSCRKYYTLLQGLYGGGVTGRLDKKATLAVVHGDKSPAFLDAVNARIPYVLIEQDVATMREDKYRGIEQEMIERAAAVIFTSEDHQAYCAARYQMPPSRVVHLRPLAADVAFVPSTYKLPGRNLVFAGGVVRWKDRTGPYGYRSYHKIFEAFAAAGWNVHLYPCAANRAAAHEYRDLGCTVHPPLPYGQLLREMSRYTAGLQAYANEGCPPDAIAFARTCRPNKAWDYLGAGIPTIGFNSGSVSRIYTEGGWGVVLDELAPEAINSLQLPAITEGMRTAQVMDSDISILREVIDMATG